MEISFFTKNRFEAMVDDELRTFSVMDSVELRSGHFIAYVDEEKAQAEEYEVLVGMLVGEGDRLLLKDPVITDEQTRSAVDSMCAIALDDLICGEMVPLCEEDEDEVETEYYDPSRDIAPEAELPALDMTPEERLLRAIFQEKITESMSNHSELNRLVKAILDVTDENGQLDDDGYSIDPDAYDE